MDSGKLIRHTRERHGISQRSLALRAGTDQAAVSRIERGEVSPSVDTVERLLAAMGEQLRLGSEPVQREYDPVHLRTPCNEPRRSVSSWRSPGTVSPDA